MFRIELLPAGIGDAIWIEYGDPASPTRIVIDGGPAPSYQKGLLARLERLKKNDPQGIIDLFVITHIDADHIDGAIILLQHADTMGVRFGEIWFNAWPQLAPIGPATYAPQQGEFLAALIDRPGLKDKWNTRTEGNAIVLSDTGPLLEHPLPNDARLTLLSPGLAQIRRLRARWSAAMRDFCGDTAEALRRLKAESKYQPPELQPVFGGASPAATARQPTRPASPSCSSTMAPPVSSRPMRSPACSRPRCGGCPRRATRRGRRRSGWTPSSSRTMPAWPTSATT